MLVAVRRRHQQLDVVARAPRRPCSRRPLGGGIEQGDSPLRVDADDRVARRAQHRPPARIGEAADRAALRRWADRLGAWPSGTSAIVPATARARGAAALAPRRGRGVDASLGKGHQWLVVWRKEEGMGHCNRLVRATRRGALGLCAAVLVASTGTAAWADSEAPRDYNTNADTLGTPEPSESEGPEPSGRVSSDGRQRLHHGVLLPRHPAGAQRLHLTSRMPSSTLNLWSGDGILNRVDARHGRVAQPADRKDRSQRRAVRAISTRPTTTRA